MTPYDDFSVNQMDLDPSFLEHVVGELDMLGPPARSLGILGRWCAVDVANPRLNDQLRALVARMNRTEEMRVRWLKQRVGDRVRLRVNDQRVLRGPMVVALIRIFDTARKPIVSHTEDTMVFIRQYRSHLRRRVLRPEGDVLGQLHQSVDPVVLHFASPFASRVLASFLPHDVRLRRCAWSGHC